MGYYEGAFSKWHEKQFGKRPTKRSVNDLENELQGLRLKLRTKEAELNRVNKWEHQRQAALYAWQVNKEKKGEE